MAQSTCPKCDNHSFETALYSPKGSRYKVQFIQCDKCGAVVAAEPYYNTAAVLEKLAKQLKIDPDKIF